jgi:tripartite-type tricarboxylate transporter receptor subunit TctC
MDNDCRPSRRAARPGFLILGFVAAAWSSSLAGIGASAQPAADFYANKTITLVIGADVGGGYDAAGRLMARFLGRFIPGNPTLIVENMPAGGSLVAANYLFNVAARDGTFIGLMQRNVLTAKLTSPEVVKFALDKFNWLGSLTKETGLVVTSSAAPVTSAADLFSHEVIVGGTIGTDTEITGRLLNAAIGTKLKIVSGYKGNADVLLAMDRGEVQGIADESWSNLKIAKEEALRAGKLHLLLQNALQKAPELLNVPLALDYARNDTDRQTLALYFGQKMVARPVMAPPGVPPERLQLLRTAFMAMADNPEFREAAAQAHVEIDPASSEAVGTVITLLTTVPEPVAQRFSEITASGQ